MRRGAVHVLAVGAAAAALGGCGGKSSAPATTSTAPPPLSASDAAACSQLEANIRAVSQLVSSSVEAMTQSLHPKELARRTGYAERNLLYSATVLSQIAVPGSLVEPRRELAAGLRRFAGDFGRAQKSVARNDIPTAARQLVDRPALAKVKAATTKIDRVCRV
jgi:hypothetical protein